MLQEVPLAFVQVALLQLYLEVYWFLDSGSRRGGKIGRHFLIVEQREFFAGESEVFLFFVLGGFACWVVGELLNHHFLWQLFGFEFYKLHLV